MKKYFATFIIAAAIISTSLVSCNKDAPAISTNSATGSTAISATAMAPKPIWPIDTSKTKSTNLVQETINLSASQEQH